MYLLRFSIFHPQISSLRYLKSHHHRQSMTKCAVERKKSCSVCWKCPCKIKEDVANGRVTPLLPLQAVQVHLHPARTSTLDADRQHLQPKQPRLPFAKQVPTWRLHFIRDMFLPARHHPSLNLLRPHLRKHLLPLLPQLPPLLRCLQPPKSPHRVPFLLLLVFVLCIPSSPQNLASLRSTRAMLSKSSIVDTKIGGGANSKAAPVFSPSTTS
jgi:hypothetical protein